MITTLNSILTKDEEKAGPSENVLEFQVMSKICLNLRYLQTNGYHGYYQVLNTQVLKWKKNSFQSSCTCRRSCMWWHFPTEMPPSCDKQAATTSTSLFKAVLSPQQESHICFHSGGTFTLPKGKQGWQRNNEVHTGSLKKGTLPSAQDVPSCRTGIPPPPYAESWPTFLRTAAYPLCPKHSGKQL